MRRIVRSISIALAVGLFLLAGTDSLHAQAPDVLRGRVADANDAPIAGAVVLLHAISESAGTELDRDTAAADGSFELSYTFEEGPLYFVATRIDGEIFMAEPFREPPAGGELLLRAGAGVEPMRLDGATPGPAMGTATPRTSSADSGAGALWVVLIGLAIVALVAWLVHRNRRRPTRVRELLVEIARLDESRTGAAATGDAAAGDAAYRERRAALKGRLVEALELDPDADRH